MTFGYWEPKKQTGEKKIGKKNSCLAGIQEVELKLRIKLRSILFLALLEDVLWKNS